MSYEEVLEWVAKQDLVRGDVSVLHLPPELAHLSCEGVAYAFRRRDDDRVFGLIKTSVGPGGSFEGVLLCGGNIRLNEIAHEPGPDGIPFMRLNEGVFSELSYGPQQFGRTMRVFHRPRAADVDRRAH